jgi:hypothetical protein
MIDTPYLRRWRNLGWIPRKGENLEAFQARCDSDRLPSGRRPEGAPCEASQSGGEAASPELSREASSKARGQS